MISSYARSLAGRSSADPALRWLIRTLTAWWKSRRPQRPPSGARAAAAVPRATGPHQGVHRNRTVARAPMVSPAGRRRAAHRGTQYPSSLTSNARVEPSRASPRLPRTGTAGRQPVREVGGDTESGRAVCVSARPAGRWRRARPQPGRGNPPPRGRRAGRGRGCRGSGGGVPDSSADCATRASSSNADGCATSPRHTMVSPGETLLVQVSSMRPSIARRLGNGRPVASNAPRSRRWRSDQTHVSAGGASMLRTGPPFWRPCPETQLREDQSDLTHWTQGDRKTRFEQPAERHAGLSKHGCRTRSTGSSTASLTTAGRVRRRRVAIEVRPG